jgi:Dyp-type peroxidase family
MRHREVTTRSFDGTGDLVVVAPLREGKIDAFEDFTFETRARIAADALHSIRLNVREYEQALPYADTTERILNIVDFRLGVINKNLFDLDEGNEARSRRYLFLCVTFDSGWEPYMRLIWRPLGAFLDVFFCNCEGYVPAGDSHFEDYIAWVRQAQVESSIFYSASATSVADIAYFKAADRVHSDPALTAKDRETKLAQLVVQEPQDIAQEVRAAYYMKAIQTGLEALNVIYKLTELYPYFRIDPAANPLLKKDRRQGTRTHAEGRYLLRATRILLEGFEQAPGSDGPKGVFDALKATKPDVHGVLEAQYAEPLRWFRSNSDWLKNTAAVPLEPSLEQSEVQAGILSPFTLNGQATNQGALLLMRITDAKKARKFIDQLPISYEGDDKGDDGLSHTIAFTANGLKRIGLKQYLLNRFPKEFRDGMELRSGILGDRRVSHPRNWILPARNWPAVADKDEKRPRIAIGEIDFVVQLRTTAINAHDHGQLQSRIASIAEKAAASGVALAGWEPMNRAGDTGGTEPVPIDHFGFKDGISQPKPVAARSGPGAPNQDDPDQVRLGEILLGYSNDKGDWPRKYGKADIFLYNSTFLVVRKIEQYPDVLDDWAKKTSHKLNKQHGLTGTDDELTPEQLKAYMMGRWQDGRPLIAGGSGENDFDYLDDPVGQQCPLASHVRRTNPRVTKFDRPTPRILRRGMSFGGGDGGAKGLMFMAYGASIAEQFEVIQRWINGGNSTGIASTHNDPLLGVAPAQGQAHFMCQHAGQVMRCALPETRIADKFLCRASDTQGFTRLHWGTYLWVPSRAALRALSAITGAVSGMDQALENSGKQVIERLEELATLNPALAASEWDRILYDFDSKDPTERYISPDIWSAIRWYRGGAMRVDRGKGKSKVVLVGSRKLANGVLANTISFSSEEQTRRMDGNFGLNYVTMDANQRDQSAPYFSESSVTNAIMYAQSEEAGFSVGYDMAAEVLDKLLMSQLPQVRFDLRRQFLMPTFGLMCKKWFGIPGSPFMGIGGLDFTKRHRAQCPGDFISASRYIFNPEPTETLSEIGREHGRLIRKAGQDFVAHYRKHGDVPGALAREMFQASDNDDLLARNITGMMLGMLAPIDANLRGVLVDWLAEETLWTHQAALIAEATGRPIDYAIARAALAKPICDSMCKRPAPDTLYRTATANVDFEVMQWDDQKHKRSKGKLTVEKGDLVIVSLASVSQRSLQHENGGDDTIIFGGQRKPQQGACPHVASGFSYPSADQSPDYPLHACPARKLMTGAMTGIMAALLNAGRIQAMPAGLVIGIDAASGPIIRRGTAR